jgi:hypothetical protein
LGSLVSQRFLTACLVVASCGPGNVPADYAPRELVDHGIHNSPVYVARDLMPSRGMSLLLAHPRMGQPAIRRPGDTVDTGWISNAPVTLSLLDGTPVPTSDPSCDANGICHATFPAPSLPPGLYGLCAASAGATDCSPGALSIVGEYHNPALVAHLSDAHVGDGDSETVFARVIDSLNALNPRPDFAVFTGDGADAGRPEQRAGFVAQLARLRLPIYVVTGNHDYDAVGIDGHLIDVGPELDFAVTYGGLQVIGVSSGQDLDDGNHNSTISESSGPDPSQLGWLRTTLDAGRFTRLIMLHHPIYNAFFATVGPDARDTLKALVTRDDVVAVLAGHTHVSAVFDADGNSRGLSLDSESDVDWDRWPLHYIASRSSKDSGGFALLHVGSLHLDYRWVDLP